MLGIFKRRKSDLFHIFIFSSGERTFAGNFFCLHTYQIFSENETIFPLVLEKQQIKAVDIFFREKLTLVIVANSD